MHAPAKLMYTVSQHARVWGGSLTRPSCYQVVCRHACLPVCAHCLVLCGILGIQQRGRDGNRVGRSDSLLVKKPLRTLHPSMCVLYRLQQAGHKACVGLACNLHSTPDVRSCTLLHS